MPDPVVPTEGVQSTDQLMAQPDMSTVTNQTIVDNPQVQAAVNAEIEELAKSLGHRSQGEWTGDPDEWVDAKTFIMRGRDIQKQMSQTIRDIKREVKRALEEKDSEHAATYNLLKQHLNSLHEAQVAQHQDKVAQLQNEIKALKAQRKEAIKTGDPLEKIEEFDDRIERLTEQAKAPAPAAPKVPDLPDKPEKASDTFEDWKAENSWYDTDPEMKAYADAQSKNPEFQGLSYSRFLLKVTAQVKKMFPEKFQETPKPSKATEKSSEEEAKSTTLRRPASPVEGVRPRQTTKSYTMADLTPEQQSTVRLFVKQGVMSEAEYIQQLVDMGEVGGTK